MNLRPLIIASLFLAFPVFAQQSASSSDSELYKIRQNYIISLKESLARYIKENNIADAADVSRELDRMNSAPAIEIHNNSSPCGSWIWVGGSTVTIGNDGLTTNKVKNSNSSNKGIWHWTDESKRKFQIEWENGFVDDITLSPNGKVLLWFNHKGKGLRAQRISSLKKAEQGAAANP
jgi:hypothetical protein